MMSAVGLSLTIAACAATMAAVLGTIARGGDDAIWTISRQTALRL